MQEIIKTIVERMQPYFKKKLHVSKKGNIFYIKTGSFFKKIVCVINEKPDYEGYLACSTIVPNPKVIEIITNEILSNINCLKGVSFYLSTQ